MTLLREADLRVYCIENLSAPDPCRITIIYHHLQDDIQGTIVAKVVVLFDIASIATDVAEPCCTFVWQRTVPAIYSRTVLVCYVCALEQSTLIKTW